MTGFDTMTDQFLGSGMWTPPPPGKQCGMARTSSSCWSATSWTSGRRTQRRTRCAASSAECHLSFCVFLLFPSTCRVTFATLYHFEGSLQSTKYGGREWVAKLSRLKVNPLWSWRGVQPAQIQGNGVSPYREVFSFAWFWGDLNSPIFPALQGLSWQKNHALGGQKFSGDSSKNFSSGGGYGGFSAQNYAFSYFGSHGHEIM